VLKAGRPAATGPAGAGRLGFSAVYEALVSGGGFVEERAELGTKFFPGAEVSADASPALLGVGYVVGRGLRRSCSGGGAIGLARAHPGIRPLGGHATGPIFPATVPISALDAHGIWTNYVRYIGAGSVGSGGFVTLSARCRYSCGRAGRVGRSAQRGRGRGRTHRARHFRTVILVSVSSSGSSSSSCPSPSCPAPRPPYPGPGLLFLFCGGEFADRGPGRVQLEPDLGHDHCRAVATTLIFKILASRFHTTRRLAVGAIVCIGAAIAGTSARPETAGWVSTP